MKLRIILLLLLLFVFALSYSVISLKEDEEVCIPCEEGVRDYLHEARENLCELSRTLKSIHSEIEADVAVYEIAKIALRNIDHYDHIHLHKASRKESFDRVYSIMHIEDSEKQEKAYADFLEEYSRLKQCNFYDSKSLAVLLSFYFVVDSQDGLLFAWFPTANLRMSCAQSSLLHKQTYVGKVRRLWIKNILTTWWICGI